MRTWMVRFGSGIVVGLCGLIVTSWTLGQPPSNSPNSRSTNFEGAESRPNQSPGGLRKLNPLQQQMFLSAQRGAEWMRRANRPDGRFVFGYVPALKVVLEGDNYLRQVGGAMAMARAARHFQDERYLAIARQAVLTLLMDTATDPQDPESRSTTSPSLVVNKTASAGMLLLAIHELPQPGDDLLVPSDQLCSFLRKQLLPNGSFRLADPGVESQAVSSDAEGASLYPAIAMAGLMASQQHRPAPWKTEIVRQSLTHYRQAWQAQKSMAFVPLATSACLGAFLQTRDPVFASFATEMNDWLCDRQQLQLDPRHPLWSGGFVEANGNQPATQSPGISSAACAESLAEACRLSRHAGDTKHYARYKEALENALQFLATLQYTEANTQHFADWYRPTLIGGFHASHQNGDLRVDYSHHAVRAMLLYLSNVTE